MEPELLSSQERARKANAPSKPTARRKGNARHFEWEHYLRRHWLPRLTIRELKVCWALNSLREPGGTVQVSHGTLGKCCGILRQHIASTTARLERSGLLKVLERGRTVGKGGKRTCNVYRLMCAMPPTNSPAGGTIEGRE